MKVNEPKKDLTFEGWIWVIFSHLAWPCPLIFFSTYFPKIASVYIWDTEGSCQWIWTTEVLAMNGVTDISNSKIIQFTVPSLASNWSHVGMDSAYWDSDLIGIAGHWDFCKAPQMSLIYMKVWEPLSSSMLPKLNMKQKRRGFDSGLDLRMSSS